jgi:mannose-6-phosphate isomerase-like protein (cupin superfamily)
MVARAEHRRSGRAHAHSEDPVFYVIAGVLSISLDGEWLQLPRGGYAVIPGGAPHDFANRGPERSGFIDFTSPGEFEARMKDMESALAAEALRL